MRGGGSVNKAVTVAPKDGPSTSMETGVATSEAATASCWSMMGEERVFRQGGATLPIYISGDEAGESAMSPHPGPVDGETRSPDRMAARVDVAEGPVAVVNVGI